MNSRFHRDHITWVLYVMLAWFAYLQAVPGIILPHLQKEFRQSYSEAGLHVTAFAAGSMIAGLVLPQLTSRLRRGTMLWLAAALESVGVIVLTAGQVVTVTVGAVFVMGIGGGLLLATIQASLADHHGSFRVVALTEANVVASAAYLALVGVLYLTSVVQVGWRTAVLVVLVIPAMAWLRHGRLAITPPRLTMAVEGRLPGVFWLAAALLFCTTAAEWCVASWGATFVAEATGVSTDVAVGLMAGYFGGVLCGRILGSILARRYRPVTLLAAAIAISAVGFLVLWPTTAVLSAFIGLILLGVGLGNLFPLGLSQMLSLVPDSAVLASSRIVAVSSLAILLVPFTVGAFADATSLPLAFVAIPIFLAIAAAALLLLCRLNVRSTHETHIPLQ
ncbi:MAG: MFS transporter [Rhodoglobus sp.]